MSEFVAGIRLEGDSTSAVAATEAEVKALERLDQAANTAAASAQRMAAGLGAIEARARASATATAAQVNAALNVKSDFGGAKRAEEIEAYGAALDATRARINPFVAAQQQFLAQQREINAAVRLGAATEMEAVRAHALNDAGYRRTLTSLRAATAATRTHTGAVRLQGWQMANLFQQVQDVGVQAAMGTNPFMIAAMQGPQITSAMGGLKNSLALIRPLFTLTTVAIGGTTAALATGALAWNSYLSSIKQVQAVAQGRGAVLGISPGDLEQIASAGAEAGDISRKTAREAEAAFLATGRIGGDVMRQLIGLSKDYAATMGMDVSAAVDDLAGKFADPKKGAEEFQKSLQLLDDRTLHYVGTLADQNRVGEAQAILLAALPDRLTPAADAATKLGRAWDDVASGLSNTWDWLGRTIELSLAGPSASEGALADLKEQAAELRHELEATGDWKKLLFPDAIARTQAELRIITDQIETMSEKLGLVGSREGSARTNRASSEGGIIARGLTPGVNEIATLTAQQTKLKTILDDPATYRGKNNLDEIAASYGRITNSINSYLTPAQRAVETERLAVAALTARSPAAKAEIAERQKRLELQGQALTNDEIETQVASAGALARASATQAISDQNAALSLNARATLDVANAYLSSAEAAQRAEARRGALTSALQSGADVEVLTRLQLADAVAAQAQAGAQSVASLTAQADAQARVNDAVLTGGMSMSQANVAAARDAELKPLIIARNNAEGEAREVLTQIIDRLTAAYDRLNGEQSRSAAASIIQGQNDDIERMQLEISLLGQSAEARAVAIAKLEAEQQARAQNINLASAEGQTLLRNATYRAQLNVVVDRQKDLYDELGNFGERSLDKINDAILENGLSLETLSDITRSVVSDMATEFLKLAALNPLKNAMFGTNYSTLGDAGGFIGSLFSGTYHTGGVVGDARRDTRLVPSSIFDGAAKRHNGGLAADEVPIIAKRREEVLTEDDPRHIFNLGKGGRGRSNVTVTNNVYAAPGTKTTTKTSDDGQGNITLDTFVEMVEDKMSSRGRSGKGQLFPAIGSQFNLDPNAGRTRSAR